MKMQYWRTIIYICIVTLALFCVSCSYKPSEQLSSSPITGADVNNTTAQPSSSPITGSDVEKPIELTSPPIINNTDVDASKSGEILPLDSVPLEDLWYWYSLMDDTHKANYEELYGAIMAWLETQDDPVDFPYEFHYEMTAPRFNLEDYLFVALYIKEDNPLIKSFLSLCGDERDGKIAFMEALRYPHNDVVQMSHEMVSASEEFLSGLTTDMNDYEKYKHIADALCLLTSYDYSSAEHMDNLAGTIMDYGDYEKMQWSLYAYGAIVRKTAVCEGISFAYQYLCNRAGLWCISIGGNTTAGTHQWNMILIDGGYYWVDVTWMMEYGERYFCLTDEQLSIDHDLPNYSFMPIPSTFFTCDATEYAYMSGDTGNL